MSFNLDTIQIRTDLTNLLKTNLTAINVNVSKEISSTNKVSNVIYSVDYPFNASDLPRLCVYQVDKSNEEFKGVGSGGRKKVDITFEIAGIVRVINTSVIDVKNINDITYMANNIDEILRENITFSTQVLSCNPQTYELILNARKDDYLSMFKTRVTCECDVISCS